MHKSNDEFKQLKYLDQLGTDYTNILLDNGNSSTVLRPIRFYSFPREYKFTLLKYYNYYKTEIKKDA